MKTKTKSNPPSASKIIRKHLIINFLIEMLCPYQMDKLAFRDLVVFMFGILLPTLHNTSRSFTTMLPGSPDPSNLSKSLRAYGEEYQHLSYASIISCIVWCMGLKDVYPGTPVYLSLDDTFIEKSRKQKSLDFVYYCNYKKKYGFYVVASHIQIGKYHFPGDFMIYRPGGLSKPQLGLKLLKDLFPYLSSFDDVTVLCDSAYAEKRLMDYVIRDCHWRWISGLKKNRKLDEKSVQSRFRYLCNEKYSPVSLYKRSYLAAGLSGTLSDLSIPGLFVATKTRKKSNTRVSWRYYYCSDPRWTVQKVLSHYENRWRIENDFWTLKEQLAISDFRYQDESSVETYLRLVFLVYRWVCYEKNRSVRRLKSSEVTYGACDMLCHLRSLVESYFREHGEAGLGLLVEEFMNQQSRLGYVT